MVVNEKYTASVNHVTRENNEYTFNVTIGNLTDKDVTSSSLLCYILKADDGYKGQLKSSTLDALIPAHDTITGEITFVMKEESTPAVFIINLDLSSRTQIKFKVN